MPLRLNVIICSTRPGRLGPKVANWFHGAAVQHGKFDAVLVDLADFDLPVYDEPRHPTLQQYEHEYTKRWAKSVASADAYVFVTPEYNYFAPPSLVNALAYVSVEWAYKPAGLVSYGGVSGGLRAQQAEKLLLTALKMMPIPECVSVQAVAKQIAPDGTFRASEPIAEGAKTMLDELHRWAAALKPLHSA
ncbi:MAG TPA: NAD(P)H-dependent oxidoreductase [Rhizobiaceae bacterium]